MGQVAVEIRTGHYHNLTHNMTESLAELGDTFTGETRSVTFDGSVYHENVQPYDIHVKTLTLTSGGENIGEDITYPPDQRSGHDRNVVSNDSGLFQAWFDPQGPINARSLSIGGNIAVGTTGDLRWGGDASQLFLNVNGNLVSQVNVSGNLYILAGKVEMPIEGADVEVVATYGIDDVVANNRLLGCPFFERKHWRYRFQNDTYYVGTGAVCCGSDWCGSKDCVRAIPHGQYLLGSRPVRRRRQGRDRYLQSRASNDITGNVSAGLDIGAWPGDVAPPFSAYLPLVNYTDHNPILSIDFYNGRGIPGGGVGADGSILGNINASHDIWNVVSDGCHGPGHGRQPHQICDCLQRSCGRCHVRRRHIHRRSES